jgi:hypothetical protein
VHSFSWHCEHRNRFNASSINVSIGTGQLGERSRVSLAAMAALGADQRDFKLTEVVREPDDRPGHGAF